MINLARGNDQLDRLHFESLHPTFLISAVKPTLTLPIESLHEANRPCFCRLRCVSAPNCLLAQQKPAEPKVPAGVVYEKDVQHGTGGGDPPAGHRAAGESQQGTLHRRDSRRRLARRQFQATRFAHSGVCQRGYVSATVQYRLVPKGSIQPRSSDGNAVRCGPMPTSTASTRTASGAIGFSAGAHLSMLLGTMDKADGLEGDGGNADQPSKVQAVVAYFGPTDSRSPIFRTSSKTCSTTWSAARWRTSWTWPNPPRRSRMSIRRRTDANLSRHERQLVPYTQATLMADAMTKAGMPRPR